MYRETISPSTYINASEPMPAELKNQLQSMVSRIESKIADPSERARHFKAIKDKVGMYSDKPWAKEMYTAFPQVWEGGLSQSPVGQQYKPQSDIGNTLLRYGPIFGGVAAANAVAPGSTLLAPAIGAFAGSQVGRALTNQTSLSGVIQDAALMSGAPAGVAAGGAMGIAHPALDLLAKFGMGTAGSILAQYIGQKVGPGDSKRGITPVNYGIAALDALGTMAPPAAKSTEQWLEGKSLSPALEQMIRGTPDYETMVKQYPGMDKIIPRAIYNQARLGGKGGFDTLRAVAGNDPTIVSRIITKMEGLEGSTRAKLAENFGILPGTMDNLQDVEAQKFLMNRILSMVPPEDMSKMAKQQEVMDAFWGKIMQTENFRGVEETIKSADKALEAMSMGMAKETKQLTKTLWRAHSESVMDEFGRALDPLLEIKNVRTPPYRIQDALEKVYKSKAVFGPTPGGAAASAVGGAMDRAKVAHFQNVDEVLDYLSAAAPYLSPQETLSAFNRVVELAKNDGLTIAQNAQALKDINRFGGSRETRFQIGRIRDALTQTLEIDGKQLLRDNGMDPSMIDAYTNVRDKYPRFADNRKLIEGFYKSPTGKVAEKLISPMAEDSELYQALKSTDLGLDEIYRQASIHLSGQRPQSEVILGGFRNVEELQKALMSGNPDKANRALEVFKRTSPRPDLVEKLQGVTLTQALMNEVQKVGKISGEGMVSMISPDKLKDLLDRFPVFKDSDTYKAMVNLQSRLGKASKIDETKFKVLDDIYQTIAKSQGPQGADAFLQVMTNHLRPGNENMANVIGKLAKSGHKAIANDLKHLLIGQMFYSGEKAAGGAMKTGSVSNFVKNWQVMDKKLFARMFDIPAQNVAAIDDFAKIVGPVAGYMDDAIRGVHYIDSLARRRASMGGFAYLMAKPLLTMAGLSVLTPATSAFAITSALFAPTVIGRLILNNRQSAGVNLLKFMAGIKKATSAAGVEAINAGGQ